MKRVIELIDDSEHIVVIQAENPDSDSLASALALESVLSEQAKRVTMYCPVNMPSYLRYLRGWDRVVTDLPPTFDSAIIVDASAEPILERAINDLHARKVAEGQIIIIDHHAPESKLSFQTIDLIDAHAVSTGQIIFELATKADWAIAADAAEMIAASILADSLGLSSPKTSQRSIEILAACVGLGASLSDLDERRREYSKKTPAIFYYKGELIKRVELLLDNQLAIIHVPWEEIEEHSNDYNPSMLVIDEMRSIEGVLIAAAFKTYPDGKVTCKLRANPGARFMDELAGHFGGGGHPFAAGFKVPSADYAEIKREFVATTANMLRSDVK